MGPVGALFTVPVSAVAINVISEARQAQREGEVDPSLTGEDVVDDPVAGDDSSPPGADDPSPDPA